MVLTYKQVSPKGEEAKEVIIKTVKNESESTTVESGSFIMNIKGKRIDKTFSKAQNFDKNALRDELWRPFIFTLLLFLYF